PPPSPPFPYTTLFRSAAPRLHVGRDLVHVGAAVAHVALGPPGEPDAGRREVDGEQGYFRKDGTSKSSSPPPRSSSSSSALPNTRSEEHTSELQSLAYL